MKRYIALLPVVFLFGCPNPPDPPTPPTPTPPSIERIKVVGNKFVPDLKLLSECCDDPRTPDVDEGIVNGWGMTTKSQIDLYATAPESVRRNAIEFRIGPTKWPAEWPNPYGYKDGYEVLPQAKELCSYANSKGFYCYVVVNDAWILASMPEVSYFGSNCYVMKASPSPDWINWATEVAKTFKDMGVIYSLDNEGFRCKPDVEWEDGLYNAIKAVDPEAVVGSSHRPNEGFPEPGRKLYDFISMQDTFQLPKAQGVPVVLVETEGLFHPEAHFRILESKAEPGVYIGRWRAISSTAEWNYMLGVGPDPGPACDAPEVGFIRPRKFYPHIADATPLVQDASWCENHGSPGRLRCPYAPEGVDDKGFRVICENEKGWPYTWTLDGVECPVYAVEGVALDCWGTENPLQLRVADGQSGKVLQLCTQGGTCGSITWP